MDLITRTTRTERGQRPEAKPRKQDLPEVFPRGRHCKAERVCDGKELSRYNPGPDCHACTKADRDAAEQKARRQITELQRRGYSDVEIAEILVEES
jgi:hypothetical protein